jgi:hypothetical protein
LTVTDSKGAFSQATARVTVVDQAGPTVTQPLATPSILWPPNHKLVDIAVAFDAADNCGAATCVLTVADNQARTDRVGGDYSHDSGDSDDGPDVIVVDAHHVRVRSERRGGADRVYTLTLTCTDAAGNRTLRTATVTVPHDSSDDYKSSNKDSGKSGK